MSRSSRESLVTMIFPMHRPAQQLVRTAVVLAVLFGLPVVGYVAMPRIKGWWDREHPHVESPLIQAEKAKPRGSLVGSELRTLRLPEEVYDTLQVQTSTVQPARASDILKLEGSLFLDPNRLVHINPRFSGDVIELGTIDPTASQKKLDSNSVAPLTVSFGDFVRKGQLLAVIWSKELGEKKTELVEGLTKQRFDEAKLKRLEELSKDNAVSERVVLEARREVESDLITIARVERTLRSWRLSPEQIQTIRDEADHVRAQQKGDWRGELDDTWARVEIRSPIDGTIVEKNVAVGDFVGTELDLFKIADLRRLDVLAHVYEEDIPLLESLPADQRHWAIRLTAEPQSQPLEGNFQRIGNLIDPAQHTALVMGWVDNSAGRLRAGQFIAAQITLPANPNEVVVLQSALVDQEGESRIFVKSDSGEHDFTMRRVQTIRRRNDMVFVSTQPHHAAGEPTTEGLKVGETVVTVGGVEMAAELEALRATTNATASTESTLQNTP